ncbi:phage holin family protein [Methylorubrum podarium]|uniref:Phage holin family protein n=1 Tax=Methylorubrum podarium TaxID=200476 RepID=A0ABV1QM59_9HYPH
MVEETRVSERSAPGARPDQDPRTTAVLILATLRDAGAHLGNLLRLARAEIRGNLRALASLVTLFGGALLLVLASLVLLLFALRDALAALIGDDALAALIVALPFLVAAAILTRLGLRRMSLRSSEG